MIIKFDLKKWAISLLPPIAVGGLTALITSGQMDIYEKINRPPLSPPAVVFPIVWSVLYILMGVSFYLVWGSRASHAEKKRAFIIYFISIFLNFIWPIIFFNAQMYIFAFVILTALFISVAVYSSLYCQMRKSAGLLQIPYIIWLIIAAYLNLSIALLN